MLTTRKTHLSTWIFNWYLSWDLTYQERQTVQNQFINNFIPVIVATSAFGMGVNKKTFGLLFIFIYHLVLQIIYKKLDELERWKTKSSD